jgi:hypothetical protein
MADKDDAAGAYLFVPEDVAAALDELPHLQDLVAVPEDEGAQSDAYPSMRVSHRQFVRIISNDHYSHLKALLVSLDYCVEQGFVPPHLVKTRSRLQFDSLLAEARVAERLFREGFRIEGLDDLKGNEVVPEFVATRDDASIAVEVYSPRTAEGLNLFIDELVDSFKNLDIALDFEFEISFEQVRRFDDSQQLLFFHPQVLADGLTKEVRDATLGNLISAIRSQLDAGEDSCSGAVQLYELNLEVRVSLNQVRPSAAKSPARAGRIHHPTLSGYAPEAMLANLVQGRLSRKVRRGQAPKSGLAEASLLVVDLTHASELARECEANPDSVRETLAKGLPEDLGGYDAVAITTSVLGNGAERLLFVASDDAEGPIAAIIGEMYEPPSGMNDHHP